MFSLVLIQYYRDTLVLSKGPILILIDLLYSDLEKKSVGTLYKDVVLGVIGAVAHGSS